MLELQGCQVWLAETGLQAVTAVQDARPDLVLMDWQLPDSTAWRRSSAYVRGKRKRRRARRAHRRRDGQRDAGRSRTVFAAGVTTI